MKFTLSWLKDHLETEATLDDILYALTDLGLEVEGVENPGERLAAFTIGKVQTAEKHPDADKLRVCQVETDAGVTQIICGAPNARAGITVVIAKPGTYVPGIDTTIGVGKIRGVDSFGMMCSEREMELSDEHDGIIELPSGEVGQKFTDWLAQHDPAKVDPVIEIAITPNRPDALGVRGIARDLAARGLGVLKPRDADPVAGTFPCPISVSIDADTLDQCPVFYGRVIRGVKNGSSPDWLQDILRAIGLRPISTLVDITNFFTFDRNRPLHVFDADKVQGDLRVHKAAGGETLTGLDEKEYMFEAGMTLISDEAGVESIGGVMGGLPTGCTDETVNVFLEAAYFDPIRTAYTGRALKINSDARYRFERGIDPSWTPVGIEHATCMILDLCGGEASEIVVAGQMPDTDRAYKLDAKRVESLVGMEIPEATQRASLKALGFRMDGDIAHVPSWRPDVRGEADLVEEVARIASLTKLQGRPMPRAASGVPKPILTTIQRRQANARRTIAALGYNECVTYSFIARKAAALFAGGERATELENPISSEMSHLRPALLPGLLQAAARNQARGFADLALFEIGAAFHGGEPDEQHILASGLLVGQTGPRDVHGARRAVDVYDAKADAEATLAAIGAPAKMQILRGVQDWWHPGRSGKLCLGPKNVLGIFGEIHPKVLREMDVKGPAVGFTLFLDAVPQPKSKGAARSVLDLPDLQMVERDFAFVVDHDIEALTLVNAAAGADKALIAGVHVFDEFTGDKAEAQMGAGKKSLAISVRLQPRDKTLTETDIEAVGAKIIEKVTKATGGTLRS
ncbi:phenylalanine--tRNA ligase subunit beta [Actibacterium sp. 188UL27-1]|uniref:phenylalanine--tRNA ligase subunit beta n=1 Tax=Actibacterium sp. 188UL27-1 TaxID=2786961 RepID=UPI001959D5FE|nr:phenylalanine--tRNA ligase subunit beta [Actibacterium sp. 188UL27-1]MBM7067922.1 phenylalanine--tRNA ligase subunit beta [Actibacterium sp. 188UL27-1]